MNAENVMTVEQLIAALQALNNPTAAVTIALSQYNKTIPYRFAISDTLERHGYQFNVTANYAGATIAISLPYGAYITKWPQE